MEGSRFIVWEHGVTIFLIATQFLLIWRLWAQQLARAYPILTAFLAAEAVQNLVLLPIDFRSSLYGTIYVATTPVLWIIAYFVVLELYRLTFEDYPGIASAGKQVVTWSMAISAAIALFYAIPDLRNTAGPFPILRIYYILERSIVLALLLFLVLVQVFLIRYHLRLSPNRIAYATGYAIYFGITVAQDVIFTSLGIRVIDDVSLWTTAAGAVVLLIGAVVLSSKGEVRPRLEAADSTEQRVRLQQQLADMNRLLTRAARGGN